VKIKAGSCTGERGKKSSVGPLDAKKNESYEMFGVRVGPRYHKLSGNRTDWGGKCKGKGGDRYVLEGGRGKNGVALACSKKKFGLLGHDSQKNKT